jgi:hypothetical protein
LVHRQRKKISRRSSIADDERQRMFQVLVRQAFIKKQQLGTNDKTSKKEAKSVEVLDQKIEQRKTGNYKQSQVPPTKTKSNSFHPSVQIPGIVLQSQKSHVEEKDESLPARVPMR